MAFDELHLNFTIMFKVIADLVVLPHVSVNSGSIAFAKTKPQRPLHTSSDMQFTLHLCKLYQNRWIWHGTYSARARTKNTTEEKSVKPVALTYLTVVCELNSERFRSQCLSVSSSLCFFILCIFFVNYIMYCWATEKHIMSKFITIKDKATLTLSTN